MLDREIALQNISNSIATNTKYRGCSIYTKNQVFLRDSVFENCSFRSDFDVEKMENCHFSSCHFATLHVGEMKSSTFQNGYITHLDIGSGYQDLWFTTHIYSLSLCNGYFKISRIQEDKIIRIEVIYFTPITMSVLQNLVDDMVKKGATVIIFNFQNMRYAKMGGHSGLVNIVDRCKEKGVATKFVSIPEKRMIVFKMLGVDRFFPGIYVDEEAALEDCTM
ncbi:STAS domain-containing protein [Candidatus Uabimicrobium amorphum]|uniref:STAS domain-containing protein n=1 Tax=Uabimicrobium amorphum TaxID=2596890 RepID=A0A5S9IQR4_UABAM|nr:STAS domain-containing protein [Candidatus Uabimicrobium amorphum]BBM86368.1 hypothetical protein UABAM_04754 [Candidatus Uabimicrobium amorphum]